MSLFPMFVKLEGRRVLVVGAGSVGEAKIESLLATGAAVRVVAPKVAPRVQANGRAKAASNGKRASTGRPILPALFW